MDINRKQIIETFIQIMDHISEYAFPQCCQFKTHMEIGCTFTLNIRLEENGKTRHRSIGYTRKMNNKKFKRFEYRENNTYYVIEEDLVGWYLIVYNDKNANESSEDHLLDTLEDAMLEAEERFSVPKNSWREF